MSYSGLALKCIKKFGFFELGMKYYCFADEGDDFWIFAPWLEDRIGVNQIKVSSSFREFFKISE